MPMQLRHLQTIRAAADLVDGKFQKITAVAWSPNGVRLAVATADRYITLYDENGKQQDRFMTKPGAKDGPRSYGITALAFSPDSTKLAVAQTDNIVFVYKLGLKWGEKKTICNRFSQQASPSVMCWPAHRPNEVVFGLSDGKLRIGILPQNRSATLFHSSSFVVSISASRDGQSFISGHLDGSIYRYTFPDPDGQFGPVQSMLVTVSYVPYALASGEHICVAGSTGIVQFFDHTGQRVQQFDYSEQRSVRDFTCAAFNPAGHTVVLGNYDCFYSFVYTPGDDSWKDGGVQAVENLYTMTCLAWKNDGSRLVTGSLAGAVDSFDACLRRYRYNGAYEFTYTSPSSVIVKRLSSGARMALKSTHGLEITKINIYSDRFLVAHTADTLLMGDLETCHLSEIPWHSHQLPKSKSGSKSETAEKFFFDNPQTCMVYVNGELSLIEYGKNEILGSCRTEHLSHHLISVRISAGNERRGIPAIKKIAYLLDLQSVRVLDLLTGMGEATVSHDVKIDWLELNSRGNKLLFRDKRRALVLYDIATQNKVTLLSFCKYVQWIPESDVIVAQTRRNLCIWYNVESPDEKTNIAINGDVEEIECTGGRAQVIVDEGLKRTVYPLDESLIAFGSAIDNKDFEGAVRILENTSKEAKGYSAMWRQLAEMAFAEDEFLIAERAYAALGDVAKAQYMHEVCKAVAAHDGNVKDYSVQEKVVLYNGQFKRAEAILTEQGRVDDAIMMYRRQHLWDDALQVAESRRHPQLQRLRQEYYDYLIDTRQEEIAGQLKEKEGDYNTALRLYLSGGFPTRAAALVLSQRLTNDSTLLERVSDALMRSKNYEAAGDFLQSLKRFHPALEAYVLGKSFHKAVNLATANFPGEVVRLEAEWGDHLVATKQHEAASNHFIQAGQLLKAISASIEASQWSKAMQILEQVDDNPAAHPMHLKVAQHYRDTKVWKTAEHHFIKAQRPQDAVHMYTSTGKWDNAYNIASTCMEKEEVEALYTDMAKKLEIEGKLKDAEKLYLQVNQADAAITMYKRARQYDAMVKLVGQHRPTLLTQTNQRLAALFEQEGNLKQAEKYYINAGQWETAQALYREHGQWDDALRVAKTQGGPNEYKKVAYAYAVEMGGDAGVKLLANKGLGEQAVEYAMERGEFPEAFKIAEQLCKHKLPDVHLQYAMSLEDNGDYDHAETEFLAAKKPKEAIEMFEHQKMWQRAMRVATAECPTAIPGIYEHQGDQAAANGDHTGAETFYLNGKKPERAVEMYRSLQRWDDASRVAKLHCPHLLNSIDSHQIQASAGSAAADSAQLLLKEGRLLEKQQFFSRAIDAYLKITREKCPNDDDTLERAWLQAVKLAHEHEHSRIPEVVMEVANRLTAIRRFAAAAQMFAHDRMFKEAIDVYLSGGLFDQARQLATSQAPQLLSFVEKQHEQHLVNNDKLGDLGDINANAAIDNFIKRGDWDAVFEVAEKQGPACVQKYAAHYASGLVKDRKYEAAIQVFERRGAPISPDNFPLYQRIAHELLHAGNTDGHSKSAHMDNVDAVLAVPAGHQSLRNVLYSLVNDLNKVDPSGDMLRQCLHLCTIAHLSTLRSRAWKEGLKDIACKASVSLLRYTNDLPVDKAFYQAGIAAKEVNKMNLAFVFFNRFVDLADLIAQPDSGDIDNSDFLLSDIPSPFDIELPEQHNYHEDVREDVRNWVLEAAIDRAVGASLDTRSCDNCQQQIFDGALMCVKCQHTSPACIVSGYPVVRGRSVQCKSCNKEANRDEWNQWVSKTKKCPWCDSLANPLY